MHVNHRMANLRSDQRGVTGLETAIIMIAFVVVASVFAYTVLSAGIFSAEKGREAIYSGIERASSSVEIVGSVIAKDTDSDDNVDEIVFLLGTTISGDSVNLTTTSDSNNNGVLSDESPKNHTTVISYYDAAQEVQDLAWTKASIGQNDGDDLLERNEKFEITVDVSQLADRLGAGEQFTLEFKQRDGSGIVIERTMPAVVDNVTDLY